MINLNLGNIISASVAVLNQPSIEVYFSNTGNRLDSVIFKGDRDYIEFYLRNLDLRIQNTRDRSNLVTITDEENIKILVQRGVKPEILDHLLPDVAAERKAGHSKSFVDRTQ